MPTAATLPIDTKIIGSGLDVMLAAMIRTPYDPPRTLTEVCSAPPKRP